MREPVICTERLELHHPVAADLQAMYAIVSDPLTHRYLGAATDVEGHFNRFLRNAGSWWLYGYGGFMLRLRGQTELIGNCGIFHSFRGLGEDFDNCPEAGWIIAKERAGQGLAKEAMVAALAWFERAHGARRMVCMISPENAPSVRLAAKLGFAAMRDAVLPDGDTVSLFERLPGLGEAT
jgi:RimJ/RimL family protein N-acetyltransferase